MRWTFFVVAAFLCGAARAGDYPPVTHLSIEQGLSNNSVRCIFQDHYGYMWFGTYDGLSRFDGYEFTVFRNKLNDSASLPHNYIYAINEDAQHNIWVGTGQGIGIYNNRTAKFLPAYYRSFETGGVARVGFNITAIKTDALGNVFIGSNGWGFLVQAAGGHVAVQTPFRRGDTLISGYNVQAVEVDAAQHVWVFIHGVGLCRYDQATKQLRVVYAGLKSIRTVVADNAGNVWMGNARGLYRFSIAADSVVQTYTEGPGALSANNVAFLSFDRQGRLWIGTEGGGIDVLEPGEGKIDYLLPGEGKNNLTSESVYAIYEDKESRQWIGTLKGGIDILDAQKNRFQTIAHNPVAANSLVYNFASAFFEDRDHNLWIGTDGGGMSIWNRREDKFVNYRHERGNPHSLSNNSITCIREDRLHEIWISTFGDGINRFDPATGSFEHFKCINPLTGEENKNVWLLYEDHLGELWATTFGDGKLYRLNREQDRFELFSQTFIDLISLTEDKAGELWAGDSHRLIHIDRQNRHPVFYEIGKPVRSIYEDRRGNFWIGTEGGGLIRFDRGRGEILVRYSDADGLCNNSVLNILEDGDGALWLSTFNGLSRFNPGSRSFKNFYQSDGLQSNQFLYSAALRLQSGEMVFGGINGFNLFFPGEIRPRSYMPPLLLTGLRIGNKPAGADGHYITQTSADEITGLKIPYNEAILSFDFAALEYSSPNDISYAYYLQGWDKDWNYTKNIRTINYTHLSEGHYRLRLKSTNAEGVWNTRETALEIVVLPPWYRSTWAWLVYVLMTVGLVYGYRRYKARQVLLEREMEINEKRLSFFTSIAHEFRTPLTLIINPLNDILKRKHAEVHQEVNIVYRNARRLLSLVDQLLLFRKAESEGDRLKIVRLNFYELCREVYLAFAQKARVEGIDYQFECDNTGLELYADREKVEIIFYNLVSNALKYTPAGGKVLFRVSETKERVKVTVSDTGQGIPKEVGQKLFDKFYQVMENGHRSPAGFGIGLYLVKQFVEGHKGVVSYESEEGRGTVFSVVLQKGGTHFEGMPVFEESAGRSEILEELVVTPIPEAARGVDAGTLVPDRQSILVIDDNEQMLEYIHQLFKEGYILYEASSGEEGLTLARQYQPDIIITDIVMQQMSGIDLCKTIKEDMVLGHIPVILLTGSPSSDTKLRGVEGGADDYIIKPFDKEILLARVASLLKNRNSLQKYFYNEVTLQKNNLKISAEDKAFIDRCIQIVKSHLDDDGFSIKTMAVEMGMSHSSLYKKIKSVSGQSINSFVRFIRLRRVAELLINTEKNVNEAALEAGFNDVKHFREQFHKLFGVTPSEYVRRYRPGFSKNLHVRRDLPKN